MKRAENYAIERGCTDAFLDTFSFEARPFYEKLGYRVFGTLENHPVGYQHYFMTKKIGCRRVTGASKLSRSPLDALMTVTLNIP